VIPGDLPPVLFQLGTDRGVAGWELVSNLPENSFHRRNPAIRNSAQAPTNATRSSIRSSRSTPLRRKKVRHFDAIFKSHRKTVEKLLFYPWNASFHFD
jgi:hypothetical protein